jgi:hypothetical protein
MEYYFPGSPYPCPHYHPRLFPFRQHRGTLLLALDFSATPKKRTNEAGTFDELPLTDKFWLIQEYGQYLLSIEYYDYRVSLCALNTQFVEIYKNIDTRIIEKICIADSHGLPTALTSFSPALSSGI